MADRVDVEAWLHGLLPGDLAATVWAFDGQAEWPYRVHRTSCQIDVRADTKQAAWRAADEVMRLLFDGPTPAPPPGGVISGIDLVTGPFWLPDDDGTPRYVVRVTVATHGQN